jgi:hypothetical protein
MKGNIGTRLKNSLKSKYGGYMNWSNMIWDIKKAWKAVGFDNVEIHEIHSNDVLKFELVLDVHKTDTSIESMKTKFLAPVDRINQAELDIKGLEIKTAKLEHKIKELEQYKTFYELYKGLK